VVYYEQYNSIDQVNERLLTVAGLIQCIVAGSDGIENRIPFGTSQMPSLSDYADGVDTMDFLLRLQEG
jgi:hypothetical protein